MHIYTQFSSSHSVRKHGAHHAIGCKLVVSQLLTTISVLCMCLHQRRQLHTMEQRHCQSQSNGCVRVGGEGDEGVRGGWGPECSEGCQDPMWDTAAYWQKVGRIFWAAKGGMSCTLGGGTEQNERPIYSLNECRSYSKVSINKRSYQTIALHLCFMIKLLIAA